MIDFKTISDAIDEFIERRKGEDPNDTNAIVAFNTDAGIDDDALRAASTNITQGLIEGGEELSDDDFNNVFTGVVVGLQIGIFCGRIEASRVMDGQHR